MNFHALILSLLRRPRPRLLRRGPDPAIASSRCRRASSAACASGSSSAHARDISAMSRRSRPLQARGGARTARRRCAPRSAAPAAPSPTYRRNGSSPAPAPPSPGGGGSHREDRGDASGDATRRVRVTLVAPPAEGHRGRADAVDGADPCLGVPVRPRTELDDGSAAAALPRLRRAVGRRAAAAKALPCELLRHRLLPPPPLLRPARRAATRRAASASGLPSSSRPTPPPRPPPPPPPPRPG